MLEQENWSETVLLTTGGEEELAIIYLRDQFFEAVSRRLGFLTLVVADNPFMDVQSSDLGRETPGGFIYSDDKLHRLLVCDELIATVFDRRNDANFHEVTFWDRQPGSGCALRIESLLQAQSDQRS